MYAERNSKFPAKNSLKISALPLAVHLYVNPQICADTFNINPAVEMNTFDTISAFARGIFVNYVWAFELVSLLLTIVIAGLSMFYTKNKGGVGKNV